MRNIKLTKLKFYVGKVRVLSLEQMNCQIKAYHSLIALYVTKSFTSMILFKESVELYEAFKVILDCL